jgi:adenine-specific DNA-methyltransferase
MDFIAEALMPCQFILTQIPEPVAESSEAAKFGLLTIADIGKERLRRVRTSLRQDPQLGEEEHDLGFRVLRVDSSNMKDVYYRPGDATPALLGGQVDNIKDDRSDEDLLFQVLLDWGVDLSLPIAKEAIAGKAVYFVDGNALAACFATGVDDAFVKELAKREPMRAVFRDAGYASDDVKINVRELFKQLSPGTEVRTL